MLESFFGTLVSVLAYQVVGVAIFLPLELAFPKTRIPFAARANGILFLLAVAPVAALVAALMTGLRHALGITPIHLNLAFGIPILAAVIGALWVDLQFYVIHRLEHRFFWRFHAVHHSIRNLSAANSFHHWTEPLWGAVTVGIPLMFFDVQIGPTLGLLTFVFTYWQFYIHSSSTVHLGPLGWLIVDNRYHRIHHSIEPKHYDHNFGAMFTVWDRLGGTHRRPEPGEWPDAGIEGVEEPAGLWPWLTFPWRSKRPSLPRSHEGDDVCALRRRQSPVNHKRSIEAHISAIATSEFSSESDTAGIDRSNSDGIKTAVI